jgi:hypothetical protein
MALNVFKGTKGAFDVVTMTAAIEKLPSVPGFLGGLGLFKASSVPTTSVMVEERSGKLYILNTAQRGSQKQTPEGYNTASKGTRKVRTFAIPHVPMFDEVLAESYQNVRAFGTEDQLEGPQSAVNDKLEVMKQSHEMTWEWHRAGCIKGLVLDADLSTIYDYFAEFGLSQTVQNFDFTDAGTFDSADPSEIMIQNCLNLQRTMKSLLGGTPMKGIMVLAGDNWFDAFVQHSTVRRAYELYNANSWAREVKGDDVGFEFGGITFKNYNDYIGTTEFQDTNTATAIPLGIPDLFEEIAGPGDMMECVNTKGKPLYAKQEDLPFGKGVRLHTQSNVLMICNRPGVIVKLTKTGP